MSSGSNGICVLEPSLKLVSKILKLEFFLFINTKFPVPVFYLPDVSK